MSDFILRTRLDVLKRNLKQGARIVQSVEQGTSELEDLKRLLAPRRSSDKDPSENIRASLDALEGILSVIELRKGLKELWERRDTGGSWDEVEKWLKDLRQKTNSELDKTRGLVAKALQGVLSMQTRTLKTEESHVKDTLSKAIVARANECISELSEIEASLDPTEPYGSGVGADSSEEKVKKAWHAYNSTVDTMSQPVFSEYVEFLGGLALRHTGLDDGICQLADEIIGTVDHFGTTSRSVTIPARHEAVTKEVARIIRLGYPEWSIWALPLAAHQFGHLIVDNNSDLVKFTKQQPPNWTPQQLKELEVAGLIKGADAGHKGADELFTFYVQHYLADAFATYTLGPAYACALLGLRLNVASAFALGERPPAANRAHIVFSMLRWVNTKGPDNFKGSYHGIVEDLTAAWEAALQQTNQIVPLVSEVTGPLDYYVDFLGKRLKNSHPILRPPLAKSVVQWSSQLLRPSAGGIEDVNGTEQYRDVLNAAWVCRLSQSGRVAEIESAATALWGQIGDKKPNLQPGSLSR